MTDLRLRFEILYDLQSFEYDRDDPVLALAGKYSRIHVGQMLREKGFHELEDPQVLIPRVLVRELLSLPLVSTIAYCTFVSCTATIIRFIRPSLTTEWTLSFELNRRTEYQMINVKNGDAHVTDID